MLQAGDALCLLQGHALRLFEGVVENDNLKLFIICMTINYF